MHLVVHCYCALDITHTTHELAFKSVRRTEKTMRYTAVTAHHRAEERPIYVGDEQDMPKTLNNNLGQKTVFRGM